MTLTLLNTTAAANSTVIRLFSWQTGYGAFAVSPTLLEKTKRYILNQAVHHQKHTFQEEYILFLNAYGVDYDERYLFSE